VLYCGLDWLQKCTKKKKKKKQEKIDKANSGTKHYIEDVTWWRGDMKFMCEWQEKYLMSECSKEILMRY